MRDNFVLLLIFLACIGILISFNLNQSYSFDEAIYISMADGLYSGHGYGWVGKDNIDGFRPPALSALIYSFYLFFGSSELVGKLVIPIVSVASVALLYIFLKKNIDRKFALLSSLFLATNFIFLFFSLRVMSENLLLLTLLADFVFFYESLKDKRYVAPLVLALCITFLVKYLSASIVLGFAAYLLIFKREKIRELLINKFLVVGLSLGLLVLAPFFMYGIDVYKNPLGMVTHYTGYEQLMNPMYSLAKYIAILPVLWGPLIPFGIYGLWRLLKDKNKNEIVVLALFSMLTLVLANGLTSLMSLRYIEPLVVFLGIIATYGAYALGYKKTGGIFVGLCVLSMLIGYAFVFLYVLPQNFVEKIPDWVNRNTFLSEHGEYKEAALWVKERTNNNDTVITDMYPFLWLYAERNWVELPLHNETEFWNIVDDYNVKYVYIKDTHVPSFFDNSTTSLVFEKQYVKVYGINENM